MGVNTVKASAATRQAIKNQSTQKIGETIVNALEKGTNDLILDGEGVVYVNGKKYSFKLQEVRQVDQALFRYGQFDTREIIVELQYPSRSIKIAELDKDGVMKTFADFTKYADDSKVQQAIAEAQVASPYTPRAPRDTFFPTHDNMSGRF